MKTACKLTWRKLAAAGFVAVTVTGLVSAARILQRPKTVIQVVTIKWTSEAAPEHRRAALEGIEKVAGTAPGVRNLWLRALRVQPRDFMTAYAIEFEDAGSADRFQSLPAYDQWKKTYLPFIDETRIQEITN